MKLDWYFLLPAIALLLTPVGFFHGSKVRYRPILRDWRDHWRQIFALGLHAVDFLRAILGGWFLMLAFKPAFVSSLPEWSAPAIQSAVVISGVLLQMLICKEPKGLNAPFAFLCGLMFGLYSPAVAGYPVLFAVVLACGARMPMAFFPVLAVCLELFGFLFGEKKLPPSLIFGAVAVLLPWLASLMFTRPLMVTYRAKRPTAAR
jgi:hypothetical protein